MSGFFKKCHSQIEKKCQENFKLKRAFNFEAQALL
jgi:hypothetical protein